MALLDGTHRDYYHGDDYGNYQFISLDDIITQFQIAYVGEDKIIPKIKRANIAFYAQRALQELSFDTFKSIKSYQIDLPPTLVMPLPHDYVNYTKISWVDSSGIKHRIYPHTCTTSNPFQIYQEDDGRYIFPEGMELLQNGDFSSTNAHGGASWPWQWSPQSSGRVPVTSGVLTFKHKSTASWGEHYWSKAHALWQKIDVSSIEYLNLEGNGTSLNEGDGYTTIRLGLSSTPGDPDVKNFANTYHSPASSNGGIDIFDIQTINGDPGYMEWTAGATGAKELLALDVRSLNDVYVLVTSTIIYTAVHTVTSKSTIDDISVKNTWAVENLVTTPGNEMNSSTWNSYKSSTPSENNNDDYQDDTYWPAGGERYGLDPQYAQVNGSFFIDPRLGRIHFSSNVSGKAIILDYISDSIGTEEEMQVHKFAEEAMYKWIAYAILSTSSSQLHQQLAPRFKKERFAAIRQAKLRLSNIKLEEITQVLRGKSKHIKH